jgi:CheY-like chemotaxis protein
MKYSSSPHPNVLLVDDNRDGLLVRRAVLEEQGYRVSIAVNGVEAFELFTSCHFDVVVTNNRMALMSGVELIRRMREVNPQARVVLLSGFDPLGLTEESTGADAIIAKNNNEPANLLRCVRHLISRPRRRKPPLPQSRLVARARA